MTNPPEPRTQFDWPIYANATFAGLAILIPIPVVDWAFEEFFRRRIPGSVARRRGRPLAPIIISTLNKNDEGCGSTCLMLPVLGIFMLLKSISRKLLYFLTVKEATDKISYYWHQAFLIDYMLLLNHLDEPESAQIARLAMRQVLKTAATSPLLQLARQIVANTRHILRSLRKARRGAEDEMIAQQKLQMIRRWDDFADYFKALAADYLRAYEEVKIQQDAANLETSD
jgi:hypothetical protein